MAITTVSDSVSLTAALRIAQPGDTVLLAPGRYAPVNLNNLHFASTVTIASQDLDHPAIMLGLNVRASSGLTFRDLDVYSDPNGTGLPHIIRDSSNLTFERLHVYGSMDGSPANDVGGLQIRDSSYITVTASEFEQLYWGISHEGDTHLTVSGNLFHDIRLDGVRGGGSSFVTVTGNSFRDFYINTGDHGDAVQFWTGGSTASAHDLLVEGNVFVRGIGYEIQGVFLRDEVGGLPFENVTIRDNLIAGASYNGITVMGARGVTVEGNVVQGFTDRSSWIRFEDVADSTIKDNQATLIRVIGASTGIVETGNTIVAQVGDGGAAALAAWNEAHQSLLKLSGTAAADVLVSGRTSSALSGNDGDDLLQGGSAFDNLNGNQGNDTVSGGPGDDWVLGGKDQDLLFGDAGNDQVNGNLGNDICYGGAGDDVLRGGQDSDFLSGGAGADYLSGDKGDDTMTGGAGADTFHSFGDSGLDRILDFNFAEGDRVQLDPGTVYFLSEVGGDTVINMWGGQVVLVGVGLGTLPQGWIVGA